MNPIGTNLNLYAFDYYTYFVRLMCKLCALHSHNDWFDGGVVERQLVKFHREYIY